MSEKKNEKAVAGGKIAVAVGSALKGATNPLVAAIGAALVVGGMAVSDHFDGDPETVVNIESAIMAVVGLVTTAIAYFRQEKPGK